MLNRLLTLIVFTFTFAFSFGQLKSNKIEDEDNKFSYLEYLPENVTDKPPLIIHLHGKRGPAKTVQELLEKTENNSPVRFLVENSRDVMNNPFLILIPILPEKSTTWDPGLIDEFLKYALQKYNVDISRVYLTGISMGGNGVWKYAYSEYNSPNKLAAIAPIAAWGDLNKGCIVKQRKIPVWAFHGKDDLTVVLKRGLDMFNSLKECGDTLSDVDYKFSAFEDTKHNSWSKAFLPSAHSQDLYQWLLSHQLKENEKQVSKIALKTNIQNANLRAIKKLPVSLKESSGLVIGLDNGIWSNNDSGNGPFLVRFDTLTNLTSLKRITHAANVDWEDMTTDDLGNVYIADIGNNDNLRKELQIYKIPPLDTLIDRQAAESITYHYEDQTSFPPAASAMNFDAEALVHFKDSLYIFTKNHTEPFTGYTKVYRIPSVPGKYKAILCDSIFIGKDAIIENQVTSAALSPDRNNLALLTYSSIVLLKCLNGGLFSSSLKINIPLNNLSQKEAICFINDNEVLITDELFRGFLGGNLYKVDLGPWLVAECK